jgi:dihydropteroate synthase type 2
VTEAARARPTLVGIVNLTEDSFSDGGRYLAPAASLAHARRLLAEGAEVVDLGAASSHPDSKGVSPDEEIERLAPVVDALQGEGAALSIDSFASETQRWALGRGVDYLNDIQGFSEPELYPELARAEARLIVMHSIQRRGRAVRERTAARDVLAAIDAFFSERIAALEVAGVARERLILDPGMGFFLGSDPEPSLAVLRTLPDLRSRFGLPVLISVSRKSFLGALTGRDAAGRGSATLAAELFAACAGVDYVRTHDVGALADGLAVLAALAR